MIYLEYIAHISDDNRRQSVYSHCLETAQLSAAFSINSLKNLNYAIGRLHDIGKMTAGFQRRISGEKIFAPHSLCGAKEVEKIYNTIPFALQKIMEYCIAGHHSGIPDIGTRVDSDNMPTLYGTLRRHTEDYSSYKKDFIKSEIDVDVLNSFLLSDCVTLDDVPEKLAFITRYCFSCLTDADSINTEEFCTGIKRMPMISDFSKCLEKVDTILNSFSKVTQLQKARTTLQNQVFEKCCNSSEIHLMNMPTGSGKTLCSIKFALERAIRSGKKRIIYIIPYNSIIDQVAEIFESTFGNDAQILRHQSTFSYESDLDNDEDYKLLVKKSAENWDAQIIITTAIQFFESVYGNKRGKLRKLHNLADSILVFDEAHLMPKDYLQPCLRAISYITKCLNSEAVFLTATMPNFKNLFELYSLPTTKILDLITDYSNFNAFAKCTYLSIGSICDVDLINSSMKSPSTLIIVNTRRAAKKIYDLCPGKKYHLSTYMTAFDRIKTISQIKADLKKLEDDYPNLEMVPENRRITVVSTSLIEAGVDLDFYTIYRQLCGLDSILQSGGRCNREGKRKSGTVYIFDRDDETFSPSSERTEITKGIIEEFDDISSQESIMAYYDRLFFVSSNSIKSHSLKNYCGSKPWQIDFKRYSEDFEIISNNTISIAVPENEESSRIIDNIKYSGFCNTRSLQKYTFSVYQNELDDLIRQHAVNDFGSGIYCLTNLEYYNKDTGISFESKDYII